MDQKILTADEAKNLTRQSIYNDDSVLYPVMEKIKKAAEEKKFFCYVDAPLDDIVIEKLRNLKYQVSYVESDKGDPRGCDMYRIRWN